MLINLVDDGSISDGDSILRVVAPAFASWTTEPPAIQSNAFEDYPLERAQQHGFAAPCMSVTLVSTWENLNGTTDDLLKDFPQGSGLAILTVHAVRNLCSSTGVSHPQGIMLAPTDVAPWHCVIWDQQLRSSSSDGRRSKTAKKALSAASTWFVLPGRR